MNGEFRFSSFQFLISSFEFPGWVPDFGLICGTRRGSLPLLPSGPGGVREHPSHRARSLTYQLNWLFCKRFFATPKG